MNANELADGILAIEERIFLTKKEHQLFQNSATMLRQQQAEIEELKKQLAFMEGEYPEPTIMAKMMEVDLVRQQQTEIEYWKEMFDKAMKAQEK